MIEMNVPKAYWLDGVLTTTFLINRMPSKVLGGKSPLQTLVPEVLLFLIPPKVFGCKCFAHVPKSQRDKLDPKAIKSIFVGYPSTQKGYKCYSPKKEENIHYHGCVISSKYLVLSS